MQIYLLSYPTSVRENLPAVAQWTFKKLKTKNKTKQEALNPYLKHGEHLEEASVWEQRAAADRYGVPASEKGSNTQLQVDIKSSNPVLVCVWGTDTCLYAVMVGPSICSSISCSLNLLSWKRQNKVKIIRAVKLFLQRHVMSFINLRLSYIQTEDCVSAKKNNGWWCVWPERALGLVVSSARLWLEEIWGMRPVCISSLHHSGTTCCRRNLCEWDIDKNTSDIFPYYTQTSISLVVQQVVAVESKFWSSFSVDVCTKFCLQHCTQDTSTCAPCCLENSEEYREDLV